MAKFRQNKQQRQVQQAELISLADKFNSQSILSKDELSRLLGRTNKELLISRKLRIDVVADKLKDYPVENIEAGHVVSFCKRWLGERANAPQKETAFIKAAKTKSLFEIANIVFEKTNDEAVRNQAQALKSDFWALLPEEQQIELENDPAFVL